MSESLDSPTYGEAEKPRDPISPLNPRRAERFNPTRFTLHTRLLLFRLPRYFRDCCSAPGGASFCCVTGLGSGAEYLGTQPPMEFYRFLGRRYAAGCRSAENGRRPCAHPS